MGKPVYDLSLVNAHVLVTDDSPTSVVMKIQLTNATGLLNASIATISGQVESLSDRVAALENGGGPVAVSFLGLSDTPDSYSGQSLKSIRVNSDGSGLEFYTPESGTPSGAEYLTATNSEIFPLTKGQPVAVTSPGNVGLAYAINSTGYRVIGLVADESIEPGASGRILVNGILEADSLVWESVTGSALVTGPYYLSAESAGMLSTSPPSPIPGESVWSVKVGISTSSTSFKVEIYPSVRL